MKALASCAFVTLPYRSPLRVVRNSLISTIATKISNTALVRGGVPREARIHALVANMWRLTNSPTKSSMFPLDHLVYQRRSTRCVKRRRGHFSGDSPLLRVSSLIRTLCSRLSCVLLARPSAVLAVAFAFAFAAAVLIVPVVFVSFLQTDRSLCLCCVSATLRGGDVMGLPS